MKTWEDIIEENPKYIKVIWYGSLMSESANDYKNHPLEPVIIEWFKRIYNLKFIPDVYTKKWMDNFKKYLLEYWITTDEEVINLNKKNKCTLSCENTWKKEDLINWLITVIYKKYFDEFSCREQQYNLFETDYKNINPETWEKIWTWWKAYILIAKEEYTTKNGSTFLPYHNNAKKWAYRFWKYFWEMFEKTTKIL